MDLRTILNNVLAQSGFLQKASFASGTDPDDVQMMAIANRAAYEIMNFYPWSVLSETFTLVMTETLGVPDTVYALPSNFQSVIADSAWETDGSRKVDLPTPTNRWYLYKFSSFSDGGTIRARFYGDTIEIHDPSPGESINFEYTVNTPITDSLAAPKEQFTLDTDLFLMDDQLLVLGTQAHWQQTKLMPQYQEHMVNYRMKMNEAIGRDAGAQTIGGVSRLTNRSPYTPLWIPTS